MKRFNTGVTEESVVLLKKHRELLAGRLFDVEKEIQKLRANYLEEYQNNPNSDNPYGMIVLKGAVEMVKLDQ